MEDDDEFGDLYTDVLRPVSSVAAHQPPLFPSSSANPQPPNLNLHSDDEDILYGAPDPNFPLPYRTSLQTPVPDPFKKVKVPTSSDESSDAAAPNLNGDDTVDEQEQEEVVARVFPKLDVTRVLESRDVKSSLEEARVSGTPELREKSGICEVKGEESDKDGVFIEKGDTFSREEKLEIDLDSEPIIPGLSTGAFIPGIVEDKGDAKALRREDSGGGVDDWDSDSEDDIQIVLNDNCGPPGMDRNEGAAIEDDDEDGEDLVIVADGDQHHHQPTEEREWAEDSAQATEGERKEIGEAAKVNGGMVNAVGARAGYINHGYHPHHSQFKYVRPGAAMVPGGAIVGPGGTPGQVRPFVNMGPIAGRGRGDWRPIGVKTAPTMQKGFHSGFGLPVWANNSSGSGFGGGLEFTLPSYKTVFDIDIDSFEEKPWRHPGVDTSDFFNFGLDEENWKDYCKQLEQIRLEATMQSKIRVYESGRSEQDYDPDLPPELAAAAGIHDVSVENAHLGKTDGGQGDLTGQGRGAARIRPPIPTGRAIQVEGGCGERLPSIDTRPPRIRDSDAIIEIVLQDSVDDDSIAANGTSEQPDNEPQGEEHKVGPEVEEDIGQTDTEHFDHFQYNGRKREMMGRREPFVGSVHSNIHEGDGILPFPPEAPLQYHPGSKGRTPVYPGGIIGIPHDGRWPQGTAHDRYPHVTAEHGNDVIPNQSARVNKFHHNQKEKSGVSIDGKRTPESSSPITVDPAREPSVEQKDDMHNELAEADSSIGVDREEVDMDMIIPSDTFGDESLPRSVKKQKLISQVEQPAVQIIGNGDELRTTRSSDNSKARSGSSKDYQKQRDGGEEEVVQEGRSRRMGDMKRRRDEDENFRRRDDYGQDGRQEKDRNRVGVKGRDDSYHSYSRRDWDPSSPHHSGSKTGDFERPRERDNSVGAWQRKDEDTHGRRVKDEDTRKWERVEEMGPRHRSKGRESERNDKDEHLHSRKRLDNGDWRGRHEKDVGPRQRERDNLMSGHENLDDPHNKRRKGEEHQRREQADKEVLHGYRAREDTSQRKRERDDDLDQRRREDQARVRDRPDDHHSIRHRDESWRQRERDDRQRLKQPNEDTLSNREREEGRGAARSGRGIEDKPWVGNARAKDESKGLGSDKDYQFKDRRQHNEQPKRKDRVEKEALSQHRGRDDAYARENQFNNEERNPRHEKSSTHNDRPVNASDSQYMHKERHRENTRSKESEGGDQNTRGPGKRKQEDHSAHRSGKVSMKGPSEQESGNVLTSSHPGSRDHGRSRSSSSAALSRKSCQEHEAPQLHHSSRKRGEDTLSDEQQNLRSGRSKLERWTSHTERDDNTNTQLSSSSSKIRQTNRDDNDQSSLASERPDEPLNTVETIDNQHPLGEEKIAGELEIRDANMESVPGSEHIESDKIVEDCHLDTVAKLKKRSERFKLPMPSEKDATSNRKMDCDSLSAQSETAADAEVKPERPARKRRWTSS